VVRGGEWCVEQKEERGTKGGTLTEDEEERLRGGAGLGLGGELGEEELGEEETISSRGSVEELEEEEQEQEVRKRRLGEKAKLPRRMNDQPARKRATNEHE